MEKALKLALQYARNQRVRLIFGHLVPSLALQATVPLKPTAPFLSIIVGDLRENKPDDAVGVGLLAYILGLVFDLLPQFV